MLDRDTAKHTAIGQLLTTRQEYDRRNLAREENAFRATHQQVQHAREYDLSSAWNSGNNHVQFGPGSCLFFVGEDRSKHDRERQQRDQMNRWTTEQVLSDHRSRRYEVRGNIFQCRQRCIEVAEQRMADEAYDSDQLAITKRLKNLEVTQMKLRRQRNNDIKAFNRALVSNDNSGLMCVSTACL